MMTNKIRAGIKLVGIVIAATMTTTVVAETESSKARGGRLYDKWYAVVGEDKPSTSHPLYPADKKYADDPGANWRCKECHGWDYLGAAGAYQTGKHASGIQGINTAAGRDTAEIVALLKDEEHGYGERLTESDLQDLAMFVSAGQLDMDAYIDRATKQPRGGDPERGAAYFNTICANCHGKEGKLPKGMKPFAAQMGNPWEVMHKILNGQPDEEMPALRALDRQVIVDIMSYMVTLPE
jgi:thiosulfate dehydrogenase